MRIYIYQFTYHISSSHSEISKLVAFLVLSNFLLGISFKEIAISKFPHTCMFFN